MAYRKEVRLSIEHLEDAQSNMRDAIDRLWLAYNRAGQKNWDRDRLYYALKPVDTCIQNALEEIKECRSKLPQGLSWQEQYEMEKDAMVDFAFALRRLNEIVYEHGDNRDMMARERLQKGMEKLGWKPAEMCIRGECYCAGESAR